MSTDSDLKRAVLAELNWEPSLASVHIGVTANDGVVALSGHVESYVEKRAAERAAGRVMGVKAVVEEIEVRLLPATMRDDEAIAAAAIDRLAWDVSVPRDAIKVKVEKGQVTLCGQVDWHYQKEAAEHDVRGLYGVVGVFNDTTIRPRVNTSDIADDILRALHRSTRDPKTITVSAQGGKVRLTGIVHSWQDREAAAATAWASPGAVAVENDLSVMW